MKKPTNEALQHIKLFITDVDGILTDGTLYYNDSGIAHKGFHVHDGLGLVLLQKCGIHVAAITGCKSSVAVKRLQHLGVENIITGQDKKVEPYEQLLQKYGLTDKQVAYMGDDLPDLPLIKRAGVGITVADATPLLIKHADWVTERKGGQRASREVCEAILTAQDHWNTIEAKYLSI